jgi:hypothetical protein
VGRFPELFSGAIAVDDQRASILQRGQTVLPSVGVAFLHGGAFVQSSSAWSGYFYLPAGEFIAHGGPYELVLRDGRRGQILVRETRPEGEGRIIVEFTGVGPFPRKE